MNVAAKEKWDFHLQRKVAFQQASQITVKIRLNSHQEGAEEVIALTIISVLGENHPHIAKGKNVSLRTHCQIHLSCEINQIAVCAAFCWNMFFSSNPNPSLSDSMSCRDKAMVKKKFLWFLALFSCCTFSRQEFDPVTLLYEGSSLLHLAGHPSWYL